MLARVLLLVSQALSGGSLRLRTQVEQCVL